MDIITLALARKAAMHAIKNISEAKVEGDTLYIKLKDPVNAELSITDIYVDDHSHLIVKINDGETIDAGKLPAGRDGKVNGKNEITISAGKNINISEVDDNIIINNTYTYNDEAILLQLEQLFEAIDEHDQSLVSINNKIDLIPVADDITIKESENGTLSLPTEIDYCIQEALYNGGENGFRKYRNGRLEQWGRSTTQAYETEFNLFSSFKDTNFSIFVEPMSAGNYFHYAIPSDKNKMKVRMANFNGYNVSAPFMWRCIGRWK